MLLNNDNLLKSMVKYFPKWTDIRKRTKKSSGGKLLMAEADEISEMQNAIDDYMKEYFIDTASTDIISFAYKVQVGDIDKHEAKVLKPNVAIIYDSNVFYKEKGFAYYEEGYLFFKIDDINSEEIIFSIDGYTSTLKAEKIHVWNVFDEFAAFKSLRRHTNESNEELKYRIIQSAKNPTNSTEAGLKNAIINELLILEPELNKDDIKIEKPTPENLLKYYNEFETIIDKLADLNSDTYCTKVWDLNKWEHNFKKIDFIPHAFDVVISAYQNGVGGLDDLKISLLNDESNTDASVTFYKESIDTVRSYLENNEIKKDVYIELKKYNDVLKSINTKYKITAGEVKDITNEPISIKCFQTGINRENRFLDEITSSSNNFSSNIIEEDKRELDKTKRYKIKFTAKEEYSDVKINKCSLARGQETFNLLKEKPGFKFNNGSLVSTYMLFYGSRKSSFFSTNNMIDISEGLTIDDLSLKASLALSLDGLKNQRLNMSYNCKKTPVPQGRIATVDFTVDSNNTYTSGSLSSKMTIKLTGNEVTLDIKSGRCIVQKTINGVPYSAETFSEPTSYSTGTSDIAGDIVLTITKFGDAQVVISNIKYTNYNIELKLKQGELLKLNSVYGIPDYNSNMLYINIQTFTGHAPVINHVYIGSSLNGVSYETDIIEASDISRKIYIDTNCNISLIELDENNNIISTTENFIPHVKYTAINDSYIKLDLFEYYSVDGIQSPIGTVDTIGYGEDLTYLLRLKKGQSIDSVEIQGNRLIEISSVSLNNLFNINSSIGDKIYVSNILKGFILYKRGSYTLEELSYLSVSSISADMYKLEGIPKDISCVFTASASEGPTYIDSTFKGTFSKVYFTIKNAKEYIAYNSKNIIKQYTENIDIVDVFSPLLPSDNLNLLYKVESMDTTGRIKIKFSEKNKDFLSSKNWSLGRAKLNIYADINMIENTNYDLEVKGVDEEYTLCSVLPIENKYLLGNGEIVETARYIITPPKGMQVVYKILDPSKKEEEQSEFFCYETIVPEEDGFNKLLYSNISQILYIGTTPWNEKGQELNPLDTSFYSIMKEEGIVVWNNEAHKNTDIIYIKYVIKIPDYLKLDYSNKDNIEMLYDTLEYKIDAYKKIKTVTIKNINESTIVDLSVYPEYESSNKIAIMLNKPSVFETKLKDGKITFSKIKSGNLIAVNSGYYYIDGVEYYMFANSKAEDVNRFSSVEMYNVDTNGAKFLLSKKTKNYIKNSYMATGSSAVTYNADLTDSDIHGASKLNSITACSTFNHWNTFGTILSLSKGLNGVGIKFNPTVTNGYGYLDITEYINNMANISLYAKGDINIFLGREMKSSKTPLTASIIEPVEEFKKSLINADIYICSFSKKENYRYYIIVKGSGIIDDIILNDELDLALHTKNIDKIGIKQDEKIGDSYISRMYFYDNTGNSFDGTEMNKEGIITNTSQIDWGYTRIKKYGSADSWKRCQLTKINNINGMLLTSKEESGHLETDSIYIGNINTVKSIIIKINDVVFDNMTGFASTILTSNSYNEKYRTLSIFKDNLFVINNENLSSYIKLSMFIPAGKVINNIEIYVEYLSKEGAYPTSAPVATGKFYSKVFDTNYSSTYKASKIILDDVTSGKYNIFIRAAKEGYENGNVWTEYIALKIDSEGNVLTSTRFENYRFFQIMAVLNGEDTAVKFKYIDLEVVP